VLLYILCALKYGEKLVRMKWKGRMILQLEEDCVNVYMQKVNQTSNLKVDLLQELSFGEADMDKILYTLYGPDL